MNRRYTKKVPFLKLGRGGAAPYKTSNSLSTPSPENIYLLALYTKVYERGNLVYKKVKGLYLPSPGEHLFDSVSTILNNS